MTKAITTWARWVSVGIVVVLLSIIALGHNGHTTGTRIRMIPFQEYIAATTCLVQSCEGSRTWLVFTIVDGVGNMVVFMPFGATLAYALKDNVQSTRKRIGIIVILGALLSICYEIVQMWIPGRVTAVDDVIINTTGAVLGAVTVIMLRSRRQQVAQNAT